MFRVELRRLLARRLTRILLLLALVGIAVAGVSVFARSSRTASPVHLAIRVTRHDGRTTVTCSSSEGGITAAGELPAGTTPSQFCSSITGLGPLDRRFHLTELRAAWLAVGGHLAVFALLLGASFVGAEWHAGTMTTLLTWEPRRTRVFVAKLAACVVVAAGATVVVELLLAGALLPAALMRGTTAGAGGDWATGMAWLLARVAGAVGLGVALGFALGSIGRNTAASLGAAFVYLVVVENLVRVFLPRGEPWLLGENVAAFLSGSTQEVVPGRSVAEAAGVLTFYAGTALIAALVLFRRRDVT